MKPPYAIGPVPSLTRHAIAYRWRSLPRVHRHRASKPQGSSERVLPWQITMDQLIFTSLSHNHYWYEVGTLKIPAVCVSHSLSLPLFSCLGCIPPLIGLHFLRSLLRSVLVCVVAFCLFRLFVLLFVFVILVDLILFLSLVCPVLATMSFASYLLVRSLLSAFLPCFFLFVAFFLRNFSRFDLIRFRLSCDHGWFRSGSVNVIYTATTAQNV